MIDVLIRNALIVDGSGNPGYKGDLAVEQDRIVAIGRLTGTEAELTIDAAGKVLCPGFIDAHTHSELEMLAGRHTAGIQMGVTTEFIGPDGFSFAPLPPAQLAEYRRYLYGVYGDADVGWDWRTFPEYLERFRGHVLNNLVAQVPHGAIRLAVKGWAPGPASEDELEAMRRLTRECMEAGAVALSTGLDYSPAAHSDLKELVELAKVIAEYGGVYATHMRGYGATEREAAIAETIAIAEQAGIGVHLSHFFAVSSTHYTSAEAARARGIDITWDGYSYPAGCTTLAFVLPRTLQTQEILAFLEELKSPTLRRETHTMLEQAFPENSRAYFASLTQPGNKWMEGKRVRDVWRESGKSLQDFVFDLLIDEALAPLLVYPWPGTPEENETTMQRTLTHPLHMVITDGVYVGDFPNPRGWGTYPRILGRYVREKGWLRMEDAIRRMTGFPAMRFGLDDRGLLRKGMAADLVIFDPETVGERATFEMPRLPPVGIEWVFVNGVAVVDNGNLTQQRPGRLLRLHGCT
jgi:N-acyl-D-amino-acid deacylase